MFSHRRLRPFLFVLFVWLCITLPLLVSNASVNAQSSPTATLLPAHYFLYPLPRATWGSFSSNGYDVINPNLSSSNTCFMNGDNSGRKLLNEIYHAGTDWFYYTDFSIGAGEDVAAIGTGEIVFTVGSGYPGGVIIIKHRLPNNQFWYSQYGHLSGIAVNVGDRVLVGQNIATVYDQNADNNTHLHWEVRAFGPITNLFPVGSAGERGGAYPPDYRHCNQSYGVGYTWDDDPAKQHPDYWGYTNPEIFVTA